MITELSLETLTTVILISGVPLLFSSVSGLIVSIIQAATSVQDQTTAYLVKLITLIATIYITFEWIVNRLLSLVLKTMAALAFAGR